MVKTLQVEQKGKRTWRVVRQVPGIDKIYQMGDKIPGLGTVVGEK